jgi:hypothetical protein
MKRIYTMVGLAFLILGAQTAKAGTDTDTDTVTHDDTTVTDTITTALYGTTTITWLRDANLAARLTPDSPLWVEGINRDGSTSLSTAVAFINQLNIHSYLGINTWRLPTSNLGDTGCSLKSMGDLTVTIAARLPAQALRTQATPIASWRVFFIMFWEVRRTIISC